MLSYAAIIAAGGSGERFGGNKLREKVGGKAVLSHSIDRFDVDENCAEVIVCAGPEVREWMESSPLVFGSPKLRVVDGGGSRAESIRSGLAAASAPYLAIHDGARPNFSDELLARLKKAAGPTCAAVPALPVGDTLVRYDAPGGDARPEYIGRAGLQAVQTPQFFERETYLRAVEQAGEKLAEYTDDSSLYSAAGYDIALVPGLSSNIKLTTPADLALLLKLMGGNEKKGGKDKYGGLGW